MNSLIKKKYEINNIRESGKVTANVLEMIKEYIVPSISTYEINKICHNYITKIKKSIPACLNYQGFPKSICISINDVVCHGIPNKKKKLKQGDIVNIDVAVIKNNYYSDASKMFLVGKVKKNHKKLCDVTKKSLYLAISFIKPGLNLSKIGEVIENYVKKHNFSVVREYCGHGIGKSFHEFPQVLHYKNNNFGCILKKGMVFTIEPMVNEKKSTVYCLNDGWTVKTKDGSFSAQYEHTITVTENGCEILTLQKNEKIPRFFINI